MDPGRRTHRSGRVVDPSRSARTNVSVRPRLRLHTRAAIVIALDLVLNVESSERVFRFRPDHIDRFDPGVRLRGPVPLYAGFDHGAIPFEECFDVSVRQIPHVPVESKLLGLVRTLRAEIDALDAAPKQDER